jgi:hypothetical protein
MAAEADDVLGTILSFVAGIGLGLDDGEIADTTPLPGITMRAGRLVIDRARLFPGDLLHEAGHLAVMTPADRLAAGGQLVATPAEEMMAIAWSYAATRHLSLPPEVVFHPDGYKGGSASLIENFAAGRYVGVPMLQWLGMTAEPARAAELGIEPYPAMIRWVRDEHAAPA